jgi:hypothetical protein
VPTNSTVPMNAKVEPKIDNPKIVTPQLPTIPNEHNTIQKNASTQNNMMPAASEEKMPFR